MKALGKRVISLMVLMCLLITEFATLISYAIENDSDSQILLENDYKGKLYENYYADLNNDFKYVVNTNIPVSENKKLTGIILSDDNDSFQEDEKKIDIGEHVYYNFTLIPVKIFNDILGEKGQIYFYNNDEVLGGITADLGKADDEYYIFEYDKKYTNIQYTITAPVKSGKLEFINQKTIDGSITKALDYETLRAQKQIIANTRVIYELENKNEEQTIETKIDLKESGTKIDLSLSEDTIYNLQENKLDFTLTLNNSSYEYELFENPIIEIELPKEIDYINIDRVRVLYRNGLSLSRWDVIENDDGIKFLHIELDGMQTNYQNDSIIEGTNIIIETTVKPYDTASIKTENLKLRYKNSERPISYELEGKDCEEYEINFMSKYGLLTLSGIKNEFAEDTKELSIGTTIKNIELEMNSDSQIVDYNMAIVNNYTESVENVEIIGDFPVENNEKLLEMNLKNTFSSVLLSTVDVQGVESSVWYSDEANPKSDSDSWTQNIEELEYISSYKIQVGTLEPGEAVIFGYDTEIPEDLSYNQSVYSLYEVNYQYDMQNYNMLSVIGAATEKRDITYEDCQIQENKGSLDIGVYASKGGRALESESEVHEGQIIDYSLVITNNTNRDFGNISVDANLINGNFYELRRLQEGEYEGDANIAYYEDFENVDKKVSSFYINQLPTGQEAIVSIQGYIRDKSEESNNMISANFRVGIDGENYNFESIKNKIIPSKMNIKVSSSGTENVDAFSGGLYRLGIEITNNNITDFENIQFKLKIPKFCEINNEITKVLSGDKNSVEFESEDDYYKIYDLKVFQAELGDAYNNVVAIMFPEFDVDLEYIESKFMCIGYYNDEIYYSNCYKRNTYQYTANIKAELESNKENNTYVQNGEDINYVFKIENVGVIDTDLNIRSKIPGGFISTGYEVYKNGENIGFFEFNGEYLDYVTQLKVNDYLEIHINGKIDEVYYKLNQENISMFAEISSANLEDILKTNEINFLIENNKQEENNTEEDDDFVFFDGPNEEETVVNNNEEENKNDDNDEEEIEPNKPPIKDEGKDESSSGKLPNNVPSNNGNSSQNTSSTVKVTTDKNNLHNNNATNKNPDKVNNKNGSGSISGYVWFDENGNGTYDKNEKKLSGITVYLYNSDKEISSLENYIEKVKTSSDGKYEFSNLKSDSYVVVFEYDTTMYSVTEFSTNSVDDSNSKAIEKEIKGKKYGITNYIKINNSSEKNINLGLKQNKTFDLSLKKRITSVSIENGKDDRTSKYTDEKLIKEEISSKYLAGTKVTVTYNFVISNKGDIPGYINEIQDYLPKELEFSSEKNEGWNLSNGILKNSSLSNTELKPGERRELKLVLTKTMTDENTGTIVNKAKIANSSNSKKYEDFNISNDTDEVSLILSVKTGKAIVYTLVILISLCIIAVGVWVIKFKVLKS